jgi:hypothetical protein
VGEAAQRAIQACALAGACAALWAPSAGAHHPAQLAAAPVSCAGAADASLQPHRVITGEFDTSLERGYVMLPFDVPSGTTAVRVRYCHDQPEAPTNAQIRHVLDLGLWDARPAPGVQWAEPQFRGWGGSSHPDVTVSRNGFSSEAEYLANPRLHRQGHTTRGFRPGPIPTGEWAVELGVAAVASQSEGDSDGRVAWRVEIDISSDPLWEAQPYAPAPYDEAPAREQPGWYAGDFHVHAEHSSLGDATMTEAFDYAFRPLTQGGAGLDFITLSDYVTDTAWGEIGRHQPTHPGKLIVRSSEVITYHGHANNHASLRYVDHRTGPVYESGENGDLRLVRAARGASALFDGVHAGGGFTQINHPRIFPSEVPGFDFLCRGCPWDYTAAETDYRAVDAIEIATGPAGLKEDPQPGPNPFTPLAIQFWEDAMDAGGQNANRIAAVGSSDSHNAGRTPDPVTQSPIGQATTVVYADELSERGIQRGIEARHSYVKVFGNDGPDLRFEAVPPAWSGPPAIMGDAVPGGGVRFTARVTGAGPGAVRPGSYMLFVLKDGVPLLSVPVTSDDFSFDFPEVGAGRYRLQLQRESAIEAVSSPIWVESPGYARPRGATPLRVSLVPAYRTCEVPDRQHGPPLAFGSCAPPALESSALTVGTPDANGRPAASVASARLAVRPGDPHTSADEADVEVSVVASDVRERATLEDHTGELTARASLRITDRGSAPLAGGGNEPATVTDLPLEIPVQCAATPGGAGATCSTSTTVDALIPGAVGEGRRAIWAFGQVEILGPDERPFLRQGLFAP